MKEKYNSLASVFPPKPPAVPTPGNLTSRINFPSKSYCTTLETASTIYFAKKYPPPVEGDNTFSVSGIKSTQFSGVGFEASTVTIFLLGAFKLVTKYNLLPLLSITPVSLSKLSMIGVNLLFGSVKSLMNNLFPEVEVEAEINKYLLSSVK